jgi:hypothetical protein
MPALTINIIHNVISRYPIKLNFNTFLETGTFHGLTIFNMESFFTKLHTIELKKEFYENTRNKYKGNKISFYHGDSSKLVAEIVKNITNPTIFWLDGHYSSGNTAKGSKDVPLIEEIKGIYNNFKCSGILIIDDFRLFGSNQNEDWSNITLGNVLDTIGDRMINYYHLPSSLHPMDRLIINIK